MPDLNSLGMIGLESLVHPVTIRYNLSGPWGISSQEITVNAPELLEFPDETRDLSNRIWKGFIARAITTHWRVDLIETIQWAHGPAVATHAPEFAFGLVPAAGSSRDHSGVIVMHTGHSDGRARRRLYMPGSPNNWQVNGVMIPSGVDRLYELACVLFMGMVNITDSGPLEWLIAYPRVLPFGLGNPLGVAFRRVQYLRICSYTGKAPDSVPLDWP